MFMKNIYKITSLSLITIFSIVNLFNISSVFADETSSWNTSSNNELLDSWNSNITDKEFVIEDTPTPTVVKNTTTPTKKPTPVKPVPKNEVKKTWIEENMLISFLLFSLLISLWIVWYRKKMI